MTDFTHLNEQGRARMVDVTQKDITFREAEAEGLTAVCRGTWASRLGGDPWGGGRGRRQRGGGDSARERSGGDEVERRASWFGASVEV